MKTKRDSAIHTAIATLPVALIACVALGGAPARAQNVAVQQATEPTNTVEVGAGYVSEQSFKFGQYNGLFDKGLFADLALDVRGGGPYDANDPTRWRITGTDLGLTLRNLVAEYGKQGKFRITLGLDELEARSSDTYQTPYLGAGSGTLTLPANWIKPIVPQVSGSAGNFRSLWPDTGLAPSMIGGVPTPPTVAQQGTVRNILATDVPAFHNVDLSTKRMAYSAAFGYSFTPSWDLKVGAKSETKDGLKAMSTVTSQAGEYAAVLPDPIDQTTDQYNASLNYTGEKAFSQAAYYGSIFRNSIHSLTWQDANDPTKSATMGSAPDNEFQQLSWTGGFRFTPVTKLVVFGSYARGTQNQAFIDSAQNHQLPLGLPASSLKGLVVTKAFNARFTAKPVKTLDLVATYKYDDRDNSTPVHTYFFQDANEARSSAASAFNAALGLPPNTLGSNINIYANRPYSKKLNQLDLDANWAFAKGQALKGGYEYQQLDRKCDGSWINCADAPKAREQTLRVEWRANLVENWSARVSYARSQRRVDYDENAFLALVPMANVVPAGGATMTAYEYLLLTGLTGFGPQAGYPTAPLSGDAAIFSPNNNILPQALYGSRNNINELIGMRRFNMADRNRDKVRGLINWEASDRLSLQGGLDYSRDDYENSVYGLQKATSWAADFDATYTVSTNFSANAFYTYEDTSSRSAGISYGSNSQTAFVGQAGNTIVSGGCFTTVLERNRNAKIDPCLNWSTDMGDLASTLGAGFAYKNLLGGKLDLAGDLLYSDARTEVGVTGGSYVNNPAAVAAPAPPLPPGTPAVTFIPAADLPAVTTKTIEARISGEYAVGKASAVRVFYWYQHLQATDYAYDGMQFGSLAIVMPTNEQAPDYSVSVVGVSYVFRWQ